MVNTLSNEEVKTTKDHDLINRLKYAKGVLQNKVKTQALVEDTLKQEHDELKKALESTEHLKNIKFNTIRKK